MEYLKGGKTRKNKSKSRKNKTRGGGDRSISRSRSRDRLSKSPVREYGNTKNGHGSKIFLTPEQKRELNHYRKHAENEHKQFKANQKYKSNVGSLNPVHIPYEAAKFARLKQIESSRGRDYMALDDIAFIDNYAKKHPRK